MNPYTEKLKTHFAEMRPNYGYKDANSLLEMLYLWYTEWNPINSEAIQERFFALEAYLRGCTDKEQDEAFDIVSGLCAQHEHLAFLEGIHVGFRLASELDR